METTTPRPPAAAAAGGSSVFAMPHQMYEPRPMARAPQPDPGASPVTGPVYSDYRFVAAGPELPRPDASPATGGPMEDYFFLPYGSFGPDMARPAFVPGLGGGGGFGAVPAAGEGECAVCLDEYAAGDALRAMPCAHAFHERCIFDWLLVSRLCPLCRFALPAEDTDAISDTWDFPFRILLKK